MKFTLFGTKFEFSYLFFAFLTLFIGADRSKLLIPLIISVAVHEVSHIIVLIFFGTKIREVNLKVGLLGVVYDDTLAKGEKILSLLAGPLSNFLLSGVFCYYGEVEPWAVNIVLAVYNMLPVANLDGGAIIEAALSGIVSKKTVKTLLDIFAVLLSGGAACLFVWLLSRDIINYSILIFSIYLISPIIVKKLLKER